eukprot:4715548-Prymnesium_polylepis.1
MKKSQCASVSTSRITASVAALLLSNAARVLERTLLFPRSSSWNAMQRNWPPVRQASSAPGSSEAKKMLATPYSARSRSAARRKG